MANWRQLALDLVLADGAVDDAEVRILKKELLADAVIDADEVKFLIELRNTAQKKAKAGVNPKFETFFFQSIEKNVLKDGVIDTKEANWMRKMLFADGKIDDNEKKFLERIKKGATKTSAAFEKLYDECVGGAAPAKKPAAKKKKKRPAKAKV